MWLRNDDDGFNWGKRVEHELAYDASSVWLTTGKIATRVHDIEMQADLRAAERRRGAERQHDGECEMTSWLPLQHLHGEYGTGPSRESGQV